MHNILLYRYHYMFHIIKFVLKVLENTTFKNYLWPYKFGLLFE